MVPPQDFACFCDEAGISVNRFTVVGGICVHSKTIPRIRHNIDEFRRVNNMRAELKWSKTSDQKAKEYESLVDYFFAMNNQNLLQFHCVIFDSHKWNHNKFNDGDRDIGLSKLYYQMLHHRFSRICCDQGTLFVCLDHRNSTTPLRNLQNMLNAAAARDFGIRTNPFKQVISADSKTEDILQLNDVILGAVSAVKNGRHLLATTRQAKREIAAMVLEKSGLNSFDANTPKSISRFTVWNFRPRS